MPDIASVPTFYIMRDKAVVESPGACINRFNAKPVTPPS